MKADSCTQRWDNADVGPGGCCHCGARYSATSGVVLEITDHARCPPKTWCLRAPIPERDLQELKILLKAEKLKKKRTTGIDAGDLLQHLLSGPTAEQLAMEPMVDLCVLGGHHRQGHGKLKEPYTWGDMPEFDWYIFCVQVADGLRPPSGAGYNKTFLSEWLKGQSPTSRTITAGPGDQSGCGHK